MDKKIKNSHIFSILTAFFITGIQTLLLAVFLFSFYHINTSFLLFWFLCSFMLTYFILHLRLETYVFNSIKNIYKDLTLLDATAFNNSPITTDMESLSKEIDTYAKNKKLELEALKIREEYRKEFIGNVSHELKTPLFTVQGYISTLIDGAADDPQIRDKYLKRADKGVDRLIYIVKDLDMITKLEVGDANLTFETFNIIESITNVFDLLEIKAEKKNISLILDKDYPAPLMVTADRQRIQQVLTNLVVNSIKYGHQNGTTEISIENLNSDKLIVRVTDNGEGVEHNHLTRLFERFYRVDKSGSREEGGSGLGLSIVKHIIEAHEEKIYVDSKLGIGSEFSFTLQKQSE
ncbi:MAG: ATP-binding protein [Flavobacteriaceae bacterium]|jgi:two-component system phosphate regulon sensor histidine kinase PhoR|nr:ATP-binding protein [Flavobacteriaceae bacterium]MDG1043147.1 ATP-binding protein [Flavobacteriaceae bacterium]MDG1794138.1 ATP-binding protein [Flavobacteriaceae bacterium]